MAVEFRITSGARSGARERFEKSVVTIGRHPMNDLRFDANKDIDVSSRHAELRSVDGTHVLHDLGSTNGTFVNGSRITEQALHEGDLVTFGAGGPQASFHLVAAAAQAATPATRVEADPAPPRATKRSGDGGAGADAPAGAKAGAAATALPKTPPKASTEVRIAAAVRQQTNSLRNALIGLAAFVVVAGGGAAWVMVRQAKLAGEQVAALIATNDSLAKAFETRLRQTGVAEEALQAARAETERLSRELRDRQASGGDVAALTTRMRETQARTASLAGTDYPAIAAANKPAIVFIAVKMADGSLSSGTGFNVLPSGLIVTNRHVVQAPDGTRAAEVAVIFEGRRGEWQQADIEVVSPNEELALLRLRRPGNFPIVNGVARDVRGVQVGSPIALLGFPLGTGTAGMDGDIDQLKPVASMNIGTVSKVLDDNLQLDVFAAQGSSGSPVLDARGLVIGVLYGAARESGGRIIYSVPAARLAALLPADAAGVIR
ncbi:MAG: trypsin-like peptidase domain-containing protein [Gemmatimonadaceae bacterium]|nr:trypsin-like peptidase domain-containing protein [Gemmatimonadaceae bacterium]